MGERLKTEEKGEGKLEERKWKRGSGRDQERARELRRKSTRTEG